jgi:ankyrin repeat protein
VTLLLDAGADVGVRNRFGTLALHVAVWCGASVETISLLLRSGAAAHVETKNEFGYSPASIAVEKGRVDVAALFAK